MNEPESGDILGFDYGSVRIGVARASLLARLPEPLEAIDAKKSLWQRVDELVAEYRPIRLVVGLPRNMKGQETEQSQQVREFAKVLGIKTGLEVILQDESLTSVEAEKSLADTRGSFEKSDVDMFAAAAILDDYLRITVREV